MSTAFILVVPGLEGALSGPAARSWLVVARATDYLGTALFVGGIAFLSLPWPAGTRSVRARAVVSVGLVLGLFGTLFQAMRWDVARNSWRARSARCERRRCCCGCSPRW